MTRVVQGCVRRTWVFVPAPPRQAPSQLSPAQGVGVLAVLHDLNLASQYADRILLPSAGRLLASGRPEEVLTPATIAQGFGIRAAVLPHPDEFPVVLARGTT